ncbi:MAG TPA: ABC transporter permease [Candidatus Acutalibacter pullicola]|uniref:ABC transporter permease n=1 Tax=Candidatus Acutalibacter pullicola TaxID=2838417 RepID=A0A9D2MV46_9FIRM|nr:ABC transporter permease [Candidatus Acutalibacter pullicola]
MKFRTFFLQRLLAWALTIWIGVTFIFFIPRMFPSDPVENMIAQMQSRSGNMDPAEMEALRSQLRVQFGLEGSLLQQYGSFLWNGLFHFDFGPSLMSYPEPVTSIIGRNLPYTLGLSLTSTLLGWVIGNFIGLLAGFRKNARSSKIMESIAICIYPIPYFLIALILQIFFAYVLGWFPISTTLLTRGTFWQWLGSLLHASILPALSLLLVGTGWQIISMKSLALTTSEEDFVSFARYRGVSEGRIGMSYVFRNCILTQITALAMSLGGVFGGSIMTEIIFGYPGVGTLIQNAILQSDYNMILGCITISIVAISTATLIVDLVYPFIDPRIRYS